MSVAKSLVLVSTLDEGVPSADQFRIDVNPSPPTAADCADGDILVQLLAISADPYLRGSIKSTGMNKPGSAMQGFVVGKILASNNCSAWAVGDLFGANLPFITIQLITKEALRSSLLWKLSDHLNESNISIGLGILGMPGSTAYGGLIDILRPEAGQTIFISAASGAVGSVVGMIAKRIFGCKTIGSCGGPEKCNMLTEKFGFDHAIDYKTCSNADDLKETLKAVAPDGIDMYFENVGGIHFDAAFASLRPGGRIAVCGAIGEYNNKSVIGNNIDVTKMIYTAQRIEGFVCSPWLSGKRGNFLADMAQWYKEGKLTEQETITEGIENWPAAFQSLFTGSNKGKVVVRI